MKVLLINPSSHYAVRSLVPDVITSGIGNYPPLGLLYIATYLTKNVDCSVRILDVAATNMDMDEVGSRVEEYAPDVVGVSARTYQYYEAITIARIAKENAPDAHVSLGGPHVNIYPKETLTNPWVDSVITGEAEYSFTELVKRLSKPVGLSGIPGLMYKIDGDIVDNGPPDIICDLDSLPIPDRTLSDYKNYYRLLSRKSFSTTLISSRGCPNRCIFCDVQFKKWRFRSADNVLDELQICRDMGISDCYFVDDTFNLNRNRAKEICKGIIGRRLGIEWSFRGRVDKIDDELLELAKESGCDNIQYGVESGSQKILELMRKNIKLDQIENAFALTRKHKIHSVAYFMIGLPGETKDDILATIKFALKIKPDIAHFTIAMPYPNTELYAEGLKQGLFERDFWLDFAKSPVKNFTTPHCVTEMTADEVDELYRIATKRFYLRPSYLLRELLSIRSPREINRKVKTGANLLIDIFGKKSWT